jgi:hypothetical protein
MTLTAKRLTVRLFPPQAERLEALAEARGMPRSRLLRMLVMEATLADDAPAIPDEDELLRLLGVAARMGNVPACRELLAYYRRQAGPQSRREALTAVDELAERRTRRSGSAG